MDRETLEHLFNKDDSPYKGKQILFLVRKSLPKGILYTLKVVSFGVANEERNS